MLLFVAFFGFGGRYARYARRRGLGVMFDRMLFMVIFIVIAFGLLMGVLYLVNPRELTWVWGTILSFSIFIVAFMMASTLIERIVGRRRAERISV